MPSRSSDQQGQILRRSVLLRAARAIAHRIAGVRWIPLLSASTGDASFGAARAAAARAAFFLAFWLMISGWAPADLPVGLAAVVGATWVSLRFLPPKGSRFRLALARGARSEFLTPVGGFGNGCGVAGPQSEAATGSRIGRLPVASARRAASEARFCALSSLMPGTLPTGTDEQGALLVHCLDMSQPVAANLAAEERLFIRAVGGD